MTNSLIKQDFIVYAPDMNIEPKTKLCKPKPMLTQIRWPMWWQHKQSTVG